ncbi:MAG: GGDEF domain-containing protein [Pseudomonadota bacterium]
MPADQEPQHRVQRKAGSMHISLLKALDAVLEKRLLTPLFQPIITLRDNAIYGYEALIRGPSDGPLHAPLSLFDAAQRSGQLAELELLCQQTILEGYKRLNLPGKLFLNVNPIYLTQDNCQYSQTLVHMRALGIDAGRVVMELTEHTPTHDYELLREAAMHYKSMGFEIAIDDLGAGYAGLRLWNELRPDYVKIDMHFVQGIHEDRSKRQFVHSIQEIALGLNCKIVAEGVETEGEYQAIRELGINYGQGYYFARPSPAPLIVLPPHISLAARFWANDDPLQAQRTLTAAALVTDRRAAGPDATLHQMADIFYAEESITSIPIVQNGLPVGIIRRLPFMQLYASRYGRDLYGKKSIAQFMDTQPLIVDKDMPLEKLSRLVANEMEWRINDDFIITGDGRYMGMGTLLRLLQKITDLQVHNARYANPLTLLPGTVPLHERIDKLLHDERCFTACYCDLDNFKPFNDSYGYDRGDEVIKYLAQLLVETSDRQRDFVGHIGGDDFIILFLSGDWWERCASILRRFERDIPEFYQDKHRAEGGLTARDRRGGDVFYPIMTLSIGAVEIIPSRFGSHHDIAVAASAAKAMAKQMNGNALFVERRRN